MRYNANSEAGLSFKSKLKECSLWKNEVKSRRVYESALIRHYRAVFLLIYNVFYLLPSALISRKFTRYTFTGLLNTM